MLFSIIPLFLLGASLSEAADITTYDRYTGKPASSTLLSKYKKENIVSTCTIDIQECDETERRRVDGSCNNLDHPSKGTFFSPTMRLLPARYANVSESRRATDGSRLPLARTVRTSLLCTGKSTSLRFTQALSAFQIWINEDVASMHDMRKTLQIDCCSKKGRRNRVCRPILVSETDPVHRFTGINCMNMTKPIIFSDFGCTEDTRPSPIQRATCFFDMSQIYNPHGKGDSSQRSYEAGQFIVDIDDDGIVWPPNGDGYCPANQAGETRCFSQYDTGALHNMLFSIWFMRLHNYFASKLAELNTCWDDETIYQTARDMNIAFAMQMYYYEYLPSLMGDSYLIKAGVISKDKGFRNLYNKTIVPQVSLEYTYITHLFHVYKDGDIQMFAPDGSHLKNFPLSNATYRPGMLDQAGANGVKNIVLLTQHLFRQSSAKIGHVVHPDIADRGQAYLQKAFDTMAYMLNRGRYLGLAPYVDYVKMCTGRNITSFDHLCHLMDAENIELLKSMYKQVGDVEVMAGAVLEKPMKKGYISATAACIISEYAKKAIEFDRHWYESSDRPHSFTKEQLAEMRKASLAQMMCTVGDQVTEIQPKAFLVIGDKNKLVPCSEIPTIDFKPWQDSSC